MNNKMVSLAAKTGRRSFSPAALLIAIGAMGPVRTDGAPTRAALGDDHHVTSIQAGFEPWHGGRGRAVETFSVTMDATSTTGR